MSITTFVDLMAEARRVGPKMVAVAAPHEPEILLSAQDAQKEGIANCTLVGDRDLIRKLAAEQQIDITKMMLIHEPDPKTAARKVMELLRMGHADLAMKGKLETGDFLRAALDREMGLRTGRLFTHVAVFEVPGFNRFLFVTDSGVVVAPTLEQKVEIVQNAIMVAQRLGVHEPKVAILAATEMVNPKIPTTMDAANLAKMADRGQIQGGWWTARWLWTTPSHPSLSPSKASRALWRGLPISSSRLMSRRGICWPRRSPTLPRARWRAWWSAASRR